ncbi:MAG TPA: hypothetical protein VGM88_08160 [Kofleriaceae bacterium]|jgi:hypothetical protein
MTDLLANLDCEARWSGVALPAAVAARISLYGAVVAALWRGDGGVTVWVPAPVDTARWLAVPGWSPPRVRVIPPAPPARTDAPPARADAPPPHFALAWANPHARPANDRRTGLSIAHALGVALPGARMVAAVAALDDLRGPWVAKAPWTSAGRDRVFGDGPPAGEARAALGKLLARHGALVVEPWLARRYDLGLCARVAAGGSVETDPPHVLLVDGRGRFTGIDLDASHVPAAHAARLTDIATRAGAELHGRTGYIGPITLDAFVHGDDELHPFCELNARYTFGAVARALGERLGTRRLGFGEPPPDAHVLVAPGPDRVAVWAS